MVEQTTSGETKRLAEQPEKEAVDSGNVGLTQLEKEELLKTRE